MHRLEGQFLRLLLESPDAVWNPQALTTYGEGYASVRDDRFRYIRYPDGSEELYDHDSDPHEWENVATASAHAAAKQRLAEGVPQQLATAVGGRLG